MAVQAAQRPSLTEEISRGIFNGAKALGCTAHLVNAFCRISVVGSHENLSFFRSGFRIYEGKVDGKAPSFSHFTVGIAPYTVKEACRTLGKSTFLAVGKPRIEQHFLKEGDSLGAMKSHAVFSGVLSIWEGVVHPVDTCCTIMQADQTTKKRSFVQVFRSTPWPILYSGVTPNVLRQFGQYMIYSWSEKKSNELMEQYTNEDPHTKRGIALKSMPQSFFVTTPFYLFQRVKTEIQCHPELVKEAAEKSKSINVLAVKNIVNVQGPGGLANGLFAKMIANGFLIMGLSYVLELGRNIVEVKRS